MQPSRSVSVSDSRFKLPAKATASPPLALRKSPRNPLALPAIASVARPGELVVSEGSGARRARQKQSQYVARVEEPPSKQFVRLGGQARLNAAIPALRIALELLSRRDGWCQHALSDSFGRCSLNGALQSAGDPLAAYYAREVLRRVLTEHDFTAWNDHPMRRRADVVRAVKAALAVCTKHHRRGGWMVSR